MMNALIVGGSSGLGLELAKSLKDTYHVFITGRKDPTQEGLTFKLLNLSAEKDFQNAATKTVSDMSEIDLLIYAAGFYQEGTLDALSDSDIDEMLNVGLRAPAFILQRILKKQRKLNGFIAITSTSQFTPRLLEPMYTSVKAGLAMLAKSVAEDERVKKVLVAAPSGMQTKFWDSKKKDVSTYLDPKWVTEQILAHYDGDFNFKEIHLLRQPPRVEVVSKN